MNRVPTAPRLLYRSIHEVAVVGAADVKLVDTVRPAEMASAVHVAAALEWDME